MNRLYALSCSVVLLAGSCAMEPPAATPEPVQRQSAALAPANDRCSGVIAVPANTVVTGTTVEASNDFDCWYGTWGPDVVYSFTAPSTGAYRAAVFVDAGPVSSDAGYSGYQPSVYRLRTGCSGIDAGGLADGGFVSTTVAATFGASAVAPSLASMAFTIFVTSAETAS